MPPADGHTFEKPFQAEAEAVVAPTRAELQILAGMPYGRVLRQAEAGVQMALAQHRRAQDRATSPLRSGFELTPADTRKWVRSRLALLRRVHADIIAEYGRYLPEIRQGRAMRGSV